MFIEFYRTINLCNGDSWQETDLDQFSNWGRRDSMLRFAIFLESHYLIYFKFFSSVMISWSILELVWWNAVVLGSLWRHLSSMSDKLTNVHKTSSIQFMTRTVIWTRIDGVLYDFQLIILYRYFISVINIRRHDRINKLTFSLPRNSSQRWV